MSQVLLSLLPLDGFVCLSEQQTGSNSVFLEGGGGSWRMAQQGGTCIQSRVHAEGCKNEANRPYGKRRSRFP